MSRKSRLVALTIAMFGGTAIFAIWLSTRSGTNPALRDSHPGPTTPADGEEPCAFFTSPPGVGARAQGPDEGYSNILPADYVGPGTCAKCHEQQYERWSAHPHRVMNQVPSKATVKGDFANHVWTHRPGSTVTFSTSGTDYWMTVEQLGKKTTRYKVTRTVGSRFVQSYIGVQTEGPESLGDRRYSTEHKLPFAYWFRMQRWVPVAYLDVGDEYSEEFGEGNVVRSYPRDSFTKTLKESELLQDGIPVVPGIDSQANFVDYATCVHCHNTYPHAYRLFRPTLRGFPDAVIGLDPKPLSAALADKIAVAPKAAAFAYLPSKMDPKKDLVTHGISCESCHMGGREHATLKKAPSFFPTNPHVSVTALSADKPFTGKRDNPATSQGICAQCHSASGVEAYPNNARSRNSAEALELLAGSCASQIRCVNCHDPHTAGEPSGGPTQARHLNACVSCHPKYSSGEQAAAHSRHPASSGVNCLDCHMPRITQGVDEIVRTHRVSPPVEQSMIFSAAPTACNLCHLDKSVRWSLNELKKGWGRDIQPLAETPVNYLDQPAGEVWGASPFPATRMVATAAYSRSPLWKANPQSLLRGLNEDQPTNRVYALFAAERAFGRRLTTREIDICAGPAQRSKQIELLQSTIETKR